ncbi:MAG: hypothetical protein JKX76_01100 [Colwellia sp.]|nr:hypothetical protein [Colwellia sp.]
MPRTTTKPAKATKTPKTTTKTTRRRAREPEQEVVPPAAPAVDESVAETTVSTVDTQGRPTKRKVDRDSILTRITELKEYINGQKTHVKENGPYHNKTETKKVLSHILSQLTRIESGNKRLLRRPVTHNSKNPSGLHAKKHITSEFADWAEISVDSPLSRIEVTQLWCRLVRERNLKNVEKPAIIDPDDGLYNILQLSDEKLPLTYSSFQIHMHHVFDTSRVVAVVADGED